MTFSWDRVEEIFDEARRLHPREREEYLNHACGERTALREEVASLLESDGDATDFLEAPPLGPLDLSIPTADECPSSTTAESPADPMLGTRLGPYEINSVIASGGMGKVYQAVRADDGFQLRVAIKVVKRGMDTDEILRRFRIERHVLASLRHPRIARLIDSGETPDGRPYFVMEYIDGRPITAACNADSIDLRRRLQIFQQVCETVQFAHQSLVVHRDLKPGNILLTPDHEPVLLDFGIAKLMSPTGEATDNTKVHSTSRMLTPEYTSPEAWTGEPTTVSCDIYSLGVLLYELISGHRPYSLANRSRGEADHLVCHEPPARPSEVIRRRSHDEGARSESPPGLPPEERLARHLSGDLDAIAMKAIHKDPAKRYPSVEQLAADLRRHLAGEPILARPTTRAHRIARYAYRHRIPVALAITVVSALGFATYYSLGQAKVARDEHRLSQATVQTLTRVIDAFSGEDVIVPGRFTFPDFYRHAVEVARTSLTDNPAVLAAVLSSAATGYIHLSKPKQAVALTEESLALLTPSLGASSSTIVSVRIQLAHAYMQDHRPTDAIATAQRAIEDIDLSADISEDLLAQWLHAQGILSKCYADRDHRDLARAALDELLPVARKLLQETHDPIIRRKAKVECMNGFNQLAALLAASGEEIAARSALDETLRLIGDDQTKSDQVPWITARSLLARILYSKGEHADALPIFTEVVEAMVTSHPDNDGAIARTLLLVADCHYQTGEPLKAVLPAAQAAARHAHAFGEDNWRVHQANSFGAECLIAARKDLPRAKEMAQASFEGLEREIHREDRPYGVTDAMLRAAAWRLAAAHELLGETDAGRAIRARFAIPPSPIDDPTAPTETDL